MRKTQFLRFSGLKDAGLSDAFSPHSFRATGITNYLENGGTLEVAQRIAGHADSRTTKLYDRRGQRVLLEDMERIRYYVSRRDLNRDERWRTSSQYLQRRWSDA
jgi:site-specific recombinase XerD